MIRNFLQSCDYENGYTKALIDVLNWFERHSDCLRYTKMYNKIGVEAMLRGMLNNREMFMDFGEMTEFKVIRDEKKRIVKVIAEKYEGQTDGI